ncbi:MAG TPA: hypothetical protein DEQ40_00365 [Oxalobacteraceae bacterium]|jgi:hypothetical protein|nr:hypothetical protein [Oxalobacteraceae bacterium]
MGDRRRANVNWTVCDAGDGRSVPFDAAQLAVLMDIRQEMRIANETLSVLRMLAQCPNIRRGFIAMHKLRQRLAPGKAKPKRKPRAIVRRRKSGAK